MEGTEEAKAKDPREAGLDSWSQGPRCARDGGPGADRKPETFWGPDWQGLEGIPSRRLHFVFWPLGNRWRCQQRLQGIAMPAFQG